MKSATELKKGDILYVISNPYIDPFIVICEVVSILIQSDIIVYFNCIIGQVNNFYQPYWYLKTNVDLNKLNSHYGALFTTNENEFCKYIEKHFNE